MEEKNKETNMLSGFFDRCKESYLDGSKQELGFNNISRDTNPIDPNKLITDKEDKIKRILKICLE